MTITDYNIHHSMVAAMLAWGRSIQVNEPDFWSSIPEFMPRDGFNTGNSNEDLKYNICWAIKYNDRLSPEIAAMPYIDAVNNGIEYPRVSK